MRSRERSRGAGAARCARTIGASTMLVAVCSAVEQALHRLRQVVSEQHAGAHPLTAGSAQGQIQTNSLPDHEALTRPTHPPWLFTEPTIANLLSQIEALWTDFKNFKQAHEASSSEAHPSPASSPQAVPTILPNDPPSPSSSTSSMSIVEESTAHPNHQWLQPIIDHRHSPVFICHIDSSMAPIYSHAMPDDVQQVLTVAYLKALPRYLGVDSNSDL